MNGNLKLLGRLTLYVTLLAVVPLVVVNTLVMTTTGALLRKQVEDMLLIEAEGLKELVESTLTEREAAVQSWTQGAVLRDALRTGSYAASDDLLARLLDRYTAYYTGLVLFTDDGRAVSASTSALRDSYVGLEAQVRQARWFTAAQEEQRITADEGLIREDPVFGTRVLYFAAPVMSVEGKRLGVLLAAFDWGQVGQVVERALKRARERDHASFGLEIQTESGTVLFTSQGQVHSAGVQLVTREATTPKEKQGRNVGADWRFVASADPEEIYGPVGQLRSRALLLTLLFMGLVVVGAVLLARSVALPITALSRVVRRIVEQGDLTQSIPVQRQDEVGELAAAFAQMVTNLREVTLSMQRNTRVLTNTVEGLTRAAAQQSSNLTRQASALQETQVTAQEIKQTSALAAEKAEAVLKVATSADEAGRAGEAAIVRTVGGMEQIRSQVASMAGAISTLSERAVQIGSIAQTVKDLADRSNMLALNAAIEAVRSGEHGKGFGVVAKEIRTLANRSIKATDQVRELLEEVTRSIGDTVQASQQSADQVEVGMQEARTGGENLKALAAYVKDNVGAVRQIASAVSQQNAGISQIFTAVTDLSGMMNDTLSGLQATEQAAQALREVAEQMQKAARSYRVSGEGA
jgi:methyl-accepting chemotaxis protein